MRLGRGEKMRNEEIVQAMEKKATVHKNDHFSHSTAEMWRAEHFTHKSFPINYHLG